MRYRILLLLVLIPATLLPATIGFGETKSVADAYERLVLEDQPLVYWRFSSDLASHRTSKTHFGLKPVGGVQTGQSGPQRPAYPALNTDNLAVKNTKGASYLKVVPQSGADSTDPNRALQFRKGDEFMLEAWVNPEGKFVSKYPYIIGKGRTHNNGFDPLNQNYALRLEAVSGEARLSFFFVDDQYRPGGSVDQFGHRWTSRKGFPLDGGWHHVALGYRFGDAKSIVGYVDGNPVDGTWDLAGPTNHGPIVDEDEVWVGSAMKGGNTFVGGLDELAIYSRILPEERMKLRYQHVARDEIKLAIQAAMESRHTSRDVVVDIYEKVGETRNWKRKLPEPTSAYRTNVFALTEVPDKYNEQALIVDRGSPWLLHMHAKLELPVGEYEFVFRALNAARFYVDERLMAETPFMSLSSSAHHKLYVLKEPQNGELSLPAAHVERRIKYVSDGKPHLFSIFAITAENNRPAELGELTLAVGSRERETYLFGPEPIYAFNDAGWLTFLKDDRAKRHAYEREDRLAKSQDEREYWRTRHAAIRELDLLPDQPRESRTIDEMVNARLQEEGIEPADVVDDASFARRVTLDLIGTIPTQQQLERFYAFPEETRREQYVDLLLEHEGWADHWVGYWQDVLAENPGMTKPMLNNSGPFRWFLHDAFADNKPFDRMVTELIMMQGSRLGGGPAGFAMASNNDVPTAARAHVIGTAFLGVEMKCARCHDAPLHDFQQQDLFNIAAMINRKPLPVPKSSSIPATPEELAEMVVTVSLKPGTNVEPAWPFEELSPEADDEFTRRFLRQPNDSRARLAFQVTHPRNLRFAKVIVNRVWTRYLGAGLATSSDDWEFASIPNPELLEALAMDFIRDGYNLKTLARRIVLSKTYQRRISTEFEDLELAGKLFATPTTRRMTAEQLVDSVYLAVGKPLGAEELNMNPDGRGAQGTFLNLGAPQRAWQLTATSNERGRPSMALPHAQSLVDLMMAYGWRQNRQEPMSQRMDVPTPLQPMALANGIAANRAVDLSDDSELTQLCLAAKSPEELVRGLTRRILSREPTSQELDDFTSLLADGFATRVRVDAKAKQRTLYRSPISWTNHFDQEANRIGIERQRLATQGDPATERLREDWRRRAEDVIWVMLNSPEFIFIP